MGVLEPLLPALQLHPAEVVAATAVDLRLEAAVAVTKDHPAAAAAALHHHATLVVHLLVVSTKEEEEEEEEEVLEEATVDHLQHVSTCSCNPPPLLLRALFPCGCTADVYQNCVAITGAHALPICVFLFSIVLFSPRAGAQDY